MRSFYFSLFCLLVGVAGCRSERPAAYFRPAVAARPLSSTTATREPAVLLIAAQPGARTTSSQTHGGTAKPTKARRHINTRPPLLLRTGLGHFETSRRTAPYGKSRRQPSRPTRDYTPLVMAAILVGLGAVLLIGGAFSSSFVPLIGVLLILLGGVVYFHWRYE